MPVTTKENKEKEKNVKGDNRLKKDDEDEDFEEWIKIKEAEFQRKEDAEADDFNQWAQLKAEERPGQGWEECGDIGEKQNHDRGNYSVVTHC